ncbi:MAG: hypothetical protein EXQ74_05835 [Thermoleophilia bacterium]|nr:hypothetical protein [Thermoleophilia bacterium]
MLIVSTRTVAARIPTRSDLAAIVRLRSGDRSHLTANVHHRLGDARGRGEMDGLRPHHRWRVCTDHMAGTCVKIDIADPEMALLGMVD